MNSLSQDGDSGSLRVKVFNLLESAIINGEYCDGDSLNEIKLSQTLGVSRTPVREALMQLELEGLVKTIPNKGATVTGFSLKDILDIYTIRIEVEGLASKLCAENITDDEIKALEKIVDLQEFYMSKFDTSLLWQLDGEFHKIIYECSKNRPLKSMLTSYHNYIQRARDMSMRAKGRAEKTIAEHRAILNAIENHDGALAAKLTTEHVMRAKENFMVESSHHPVGNDVKQPAKE